MKHLENEQCVVGRSPIKGVQIADTERLQNILPEELNLRKPKARWMLHLLNTVKKQMNEFGGNFSTILKRIQLICC